jgi:gluconolactonase
MRRREFIRTTTTAATACAAARFTDIAAAAGISDMYGTLTAGKYLGKLQVLAKVTDDKVFTEGPCCNRAGDVYFTNTSASKILKWNGSQLSVFRQDQNAANGLLFDRQGRLVACEGATGRVTRTDMQTGKITVLVDQFNGHSLGAPNDLCFDNRDRIYFTSRFSNADPAQRNVNAVYRIDPDGRVERILSAPQIDMPNGLVTSPDDKTLYLIESDPRSDRHRSILAYDLNVDGNVSKPRTLIDFYPGRSGDGMAIDEEGNLYVAAGLHKPRGTSETLDTRPGIHVISAGGKLLDFMQTPDDTLTNCRFGDADLKTLYITSGSQLLSLRTQIPGKKLYRPEQ